MKVILVVIFLFVRHNCVKIYTTKGENNEDYNFWMRSGRQELDAALKRYAGLRGDGKAPKFWKRPKNVIIFVGDGMSLTTNTAARIYRGQQRLNVAGEDTTLSWETFPELGLSKTYNVDRQTPDSAGTATAIFSGIKSNMKIIGLDAKAKPGSAKSAREAKKATSILNWAQKAGMRTGIVTTARITHATPAATYAHTPHRDWECDAALKRNNGVGEADIVAEGEPEPDYDKDLDIARQLIHGETGSKLNVALGGGLTNFVKVSGVEKPTGTCVREDGRDLVQEWKMKKKNQDITYRYVNNTGQLLDIATDNVDQVLGIFANSHLDYDYARDKTDAGQPSLSQMATTAVKILDQGRNGFALCVEGARIDHGHHDNYANLALDETVAMDQALRDVMALLKERDILEETLIIVTADHSHAMTMSGYPKRGTDIRGTTGFKTAEGNEEMILSYANGKGVRGIHPEKPNAAGKCVRAELVDEEMKSFDYRHPSVIYDNGEHHGGDDVGIWATGPMAFLFHKTHEQSYIAHVVGYSLCIGPYEDDSECTRRQNVKSLGSHSLKSSVIVIILSLILPWLLINPK